MSQRSVGLLHPGQMGHSVGASARASGARVLWASAGRSESTRTRAEKAGLEDVGGVVELATRSAVILAVCPPDAARDTAQLALSAGFSGTYVDANAVSPATARAIAADVEKAGARFVDAGIIGPPAHVEGTTRLYLSGKGSDEIAALFSAGPLEAIPIKGAAGAASALKMAFAAYTKGTSALLMAIRALARAEDVDEALLSEWSRSIPDLPARSEGAMRGTLPKAWRFVGEMGEIAATFEQAGLPGGFHAAAAEIYERLARYKDADEMPDSDEVLARLLGAD